MGAKYEKSQVNLEEEPIDQAENSEANFAAFPLSKGFCCAWGISGQLCYPFHGKTLIKVHSESEK